MKRGSSLIWILLFFVILIILVRTGLLSPISEWLAKRYVFPEQCEKQYPAQYKYMIYDYCNLVKYNITVDDVDVRTIFIPPDRCRFTIFIKNEKIYEFELAYKQAKMIKCEDIIRRWS